MHSSPTRERVAYAQSASKAAANPAAPTPPRLVAGLCDFTDLETIYERYSRTLHVRTARFKRNRTLLAHATPADIADIAAIAEAIYAELDDDQEHFTILTCGLSGQIYGFKVIATGTYGHVEVPHDAVLRAALLLGARALILLHNHPSGNLCPSQRDLVLTRRLRTLAGMHDIDILDHIIYSPDTGAFGIRPLCPEIWPEDHAGG